MDQNKHNKNIYILRVILIGGIVIGSQGLDLNKKQIWMYMYSIARCILYILTVRALYEVCGLIYDVVRNKRAIDDQVLKKLDSHHVMMFFAAIAILLYNEQTLIDKSFVMILMATVIAKFPEIGKKHKVSLNYAVGMACSYFEGYLVHILPSDGTKFFGVQNKIRAYEAREGVVFPIKKLFIVATKSLYSPPELEDMNKPDKDGIAYLEACTALNEIEKDVAGVKNRIYKNFAYKIYRPHRLRPVCVAAVGGTPMHTLYKVLKNKDLSDVLPGINREETVAEFFKTLRKFIARSPECRDKCVLISYDDADRELNLADVLLDKIRELEPNFEEMIS